MYVSDKQLKFVSDSISDCLFCKSFLGGMPQTPRRLVLHTVPVCFTHQDTAPLPYDHAISEIADQVWFQLAILA